ncbi:MAG: peptidylprolyl isomerase [Bacteriovoracia bacterium]
MPKKWSSKISYVIITFFILAIIVSFALTGFDDGQYDSGGVQAVAKVDDNPIRYTEFQRVYQSQLDYYSKLRGGKSLTTKEIEMFGIKKQALDVLIMQKLLENLADDLNFIPGKKEIAEEIKQLPYFQSDGKFDIQKYKQLLRANRYTPADFEEEITKDLMTNKVREFLEFRLISDNYLKDVKKFKSMKANATAVKLYKTALEKFIPVSDKDIAEFVANPDSEGKLQNLYNQRKSQFQAQIQASHILIKPKEGADAEAQKRIEQLSQKVTPKNFAAMAKKHSEGPSKNKGGSLGWFGRGKMVPAFEEVAFNLKPGTISDPIKTQFGYHLIYVQSKKDERSLDDVRNTLAKELVQKEKTDKLDKVAGEVVSKIQKNMNNPKRLDTLAKEYNFIIQKGKELNRFDGTVGTIELNQLQLSQIFTKDKVEYDTFSFTKGPSILVVKTEKLPSEAKDKDKKEDGEESLKQIKLALTNKIRSEIMKGLREKAEIVTFADFLN